MKKSATTFVVGPAQHAKHGVFREVTLPRGGTAQVMDRKVFRAAAKKADRKILELGRTATKADN